jgi:hypothetical protein
MWHDDLGARGGEREREMFNGGKENCLYMTLPTKLSVCGEGGSLLQGGWSIDLVGMSILLQEP